MPSDEPYDNVDLWHDRQPPDGTEEQLMAHAALYLAWAAGAGLLADNPDLSGLDRALSARAITPLEWYWERFGNAFFPEDLTAAGQRFTEAYYVIGHGTDDPDLGPFVDEYLALVPGADAMGAAGDWADFDLLAPRIAQRHAAFLGGELT
jgi:hypothetical protein